MSVICYDICDDRHMAIAFEFLDTLLLQPMSKPGVKSNGIIVTADWPYKCHRVINALRPQVLRQFFGKYDEDTEMIAAYGVGSGCTTVGTSPRLVQQLCIQVFH